MSDKKNENHSEVLFYNKLKLMEIPPYLKEINNINWEELSSFFPEDSSYIPLYLKGLTSTDEEIRKSSINRLEDLILHQGTIDEVTGYVIPFLIKILDANKAMQQDILYLLPELALDYYYGTDEECTAIEDVAKGLPIYKKLIKENNFDIKKQVILLLSIAPLTPEDSVKILLEALSIENNEIQIANILYGLGMLLEASGTRVKEIESYLQNDNMFLQFCSATTLFYINEEKVDKNVLNIISNGAMNPEKIKKGYEQIVFGESMELDIVPILNYFDEKIANKIGSDFIKSINKQNFISKLDLIEEMLNVVFGENGYTGKKLTKLQKEMINFFIPCLDSEFVNIDLMDILDSFGLPEDLDELKQLVSSS